MRMAYYLVRMLCEYRCLCTVHVCTKYGVGALYFFPVGGCMALATATAAAVYVVIFLSFARQRDSISRQGKSSRNRVCRKSDEWKSS
jgi:hypothetical protein